MRKMVLVCDDEKAIAESYALAVETILEETVAARKRVEVRWFSGMRVRQEAERFVQSLLESGETVDCLLLSDWAMPLSGEGTELIRALREQVAKAPGRFTLAAVICSGGGAKAEYDADCLGVRFLRKPFSIADLRRELLSDLIRLAA